MKVMFSWILLQIIAKQFYSMMLTLNVQKQNRLLQLSKSLLIFQTSVLPLKLSQRSPINDMRCLRPFRSGNVTSICQLTLMMPLSVFVFCKNNITYFMKLICSYYMRQT